VIDHRAVLRLIKPLADRVALAIGRAVLRLVSERAGVQLVQVEGLKGDVLDKVEHLQAYGFASHPLPGAEAVVLAIGGARNHPLVVVIADRRYRPGLEAGETIIHDDQGQVIHIARDRILLKTDALLRIEAAEVEIHGDTRVRIDAGGAGVTYFPDSTHDWRQGLPTVNHPPAPPEHSP
jgi:phage baseplate assembly protein V